MRRTEGRRWAALAIAAGFPAALMLGVLVEQQFQVVPIHDPTGGWRGHVWDNYGHAVVDCVAEAIAAFAGTSVAAQALTPPVHRLLPPWRHTSATPAGAR